MTPPDLKVVWPKDKGGKAGFWGRFSDILTGKGPDMFLQGTHDNRKIPTDRWGNWDGYHSRDRHFQELRQMNTRGAQRYDPESRKYVEWAIPTDWYAAEPRFNPTTGIYDAHYPCFTADEVREAYQDYKRGGGTFTPAHMRSGWNDQGPDRFNPTHNDFWRGAHRIGENVRQGSNWDAKALNPLMQMSNYTPFDVNEWFHRDVRGV